MEKNEEIRPNFSAMLIPLQGIRTFVSHPALWWTALSWTIISLFILGALFFSLLVWLWPTADGSTVHYLIGGSEAMGYSLLAIVFFWIFIMPIPTAVFYERMLRKVLERRGVRVEGERFLKGLTSSLKVIKGTLLQRIFWAIFPLLFLPFVPPLFTFFSFVGMGYITLIDAGDLSLALQGYEGPHRLHFLRQQKATLLAGGLIAGILMGLFLFTLIGFVFLIPSLYVGTLMWVIKK